ncbi:MAG: hypothetical protein AAF456_22765 [Planctomycetota bacterium]
MNIKQMNQVLMSSVAMENSVSGRYVELDGEVFYRIANSHLMAPFFMSLSSSSDHWMFISSTGALTAGRADADGALFPYYSADKIENLRHCTGPRTIIRITDGEVTKVWEPFAGDAKSRPVTQNIYKNGTGNQLIFEEHHKELDLVFRYRWTFGHRFGFIRTCVLSNRSGRAVTLNLLDGLQNLLPADVDHGFQMRFSNLGDAYKKSELLPESRTGIYYLSSVPTDRAEPSEGLRANTAWSFGPAPQHVLITDKQIDSFRETGSVETESDVRAHRGAYLVQHAFSIEAGENETWSIVANTGLDTTDVVNLDRDIRSKPEMPELVEDDVRRCSLRLLRIISASDGCQSGADPLCTSRHKSNTLFNVMRGGIPANGYEIDPLDFRGQVADFNREIAAAHADLLDDLCREHAAGIHFDKLMQALEATNDSDLIRIGREFLPLTFSRRHGDPTRPWNAFSIKGFSDDGNRTIDYQGNWRDIFQNWEALAMSYPRLTAGMILRFLNASTADGYNPYRLTRDGFEWESPDPHDPWSNIGYWGDHQIIYLLKLLELSRRIDPSGLDQLLDKPRCTYANVPYRIKAYADILKDPRDTIEFDFDLERSIEAVVAANGSDGKLLRNPEGSTLHVTAGEKLLLPALVKMTNFVPDGGIWLNTQRPEWNDANNALVGNGMSVVTACYLRRYFAFLKNWFADVDRSFDCSVEIAALAAQIVQILKSNTDLLVSCTSAGRKALVDALSGAGSDYRRALYSDGLSGESRQFTASEVVDLCDQCLTWIEQTIRSNKREDGLYHSYNLLRLDYSSSCKLTGMSIERLNEMLEGQVAVLSSGLPDAEEAASILDALRDSRMYRLDQNSYTLYPDKDLPRFTDKNRIPADSLQGSELAKRLLETGDGVIRMDDAGELHFVGEFRNANDLHRALDELKEKAGYAELVEDDRRLFALTFESVFRHHEFVGRSGTFFGYEGLGSIYWHMVSKLVLAVQECYVEARAAGVAIELQDRLQDHYRSIRDGLGVKKQPDHYGAFPTDPYSHTPAHAGAQQPGMTGQVKEDILSRWCEIGVRINDGKVQFDPCLFETSEMLIDPAMFEYVDLEGNLVSFEIAAQSFGFTICQIPVVYQLSGSTAIEVQTRDGNIVREGDFSLTAEESAHLFARDGFIKRINFQF